MSKASYYSTMLAQIRVRKVAPKAWNYLKYRRYGKKPVLSTGQYTPQIAELLLTKRCNLDCSFCSVAKHLHSDVAWRDNEAHLHTVERIFENPLFANCLLVDLLGGDPLLVKDLDRIVAFLTERGHLTNTSTNGLLLADRVADLKQAGISRINVSIYDDNRAVLERTLEQINHIFPVHTSVILFASDVVNNPKKLVETVRFARKSGCASVRFWMYRPMGEDPKKEEILLETDPAYLDFRRRVEEDFPDYCIWPEAVQAGGAEKRCAQLWQRIGCDMLGNMRICCGIDTMLAEPTVNLFKNTPEEVWNHPELVRMREGLLHPSRDVVPPACKSCNLLGDPGW